MSTIYRQYKPYVNFANGLDNTTPISSPEIQNTLSECKNGIISEDDIVATRPGFTGITTTKSNYIIREGIEYIKPDGTRENIVYLESTTLTGNSGILGKIDGNSITNITTNLPDGIKPTMIQAGVLLFVFTGIEDFIYDGSTTRQIGIDYPSNKPIFQTNVFGSLNEDGQYLFVYTYYNSETGAESSPSLASDIMDAGLLKGIRIQLTAGDSSLADTIKVYRTVSGGNVFFLDGTTTINAATYDSTISDQALGTELELDNSRLPEPAKYAILIDNRLFVAGFASNKNRVRFSKIGINGTMFESFQVADFIDTNPNDRDEVIGLGKIANKIGVLKNRSVGKLIPIELNIGGLERSGSQKYIFKRLSDPCTATKHHSIFQIQENMGWIGLDNIYITNGLDVVPIANRIRNIVRKLNHNKSYKYSSYVKTDSQQIIISVVREGQSEPDYQLVGHYRNYPTIAWTTFTPGPESSTHPGIPMASIWSTLVNGLTEPYFGSSNTNGKVYQYAKGNTDDGDPIYFSVKLPWEIGPDAMGLKSFHSIKYLATTQAASPNNVIVNTWEENGKESVVKQQTSTIPTSTKWGTAKWATFTWAGAQFNKINFYPNRKAYLGRFGFYNDKSNAPIAIKSMRLLYRPFPD